MKTLLMILALGFSTVSFAQVKKVNMQASGLTCSMCSNAINKSLKALDFVEKVMSDIRTSSFEITFKPGAEIDFDKLKKKVEDAGFFVSTFVATINFEGESIKNDAHLKTGNRTFHFLNVKSQSLSGEQQIRFLDKGFVSSKAFKKNSSFTAMPCYKTGVAESCCTKDGLIKGSRIFHVTI